jgi:hypothetical protein
MAPASVVKVTATKQEAVADKGLKKESTWMNDGKCGIR